MTIHRSLLAGTLFLPMLCLASSSLMAANVRVAHLSPDAPAVDVLVGASEDSKAAVLENVAFPAVSGYLPVADGSYFIDVTQTGTTSPAVIDVNDFALAGDLTIAAVGQLADIEPLVLMDDRVTDPTKAKLRAVHASPNAPAVDIFVDGAGLLPQLTNLAFKDSTGYLPLDPGEYTLRIRETGMTNDLFVVEDLALSANTNYSAFAIGLVGDDFTVLPAVDAVPEPSTASLLGLTMLGLTAIGRRRRQ